MISNIRFSYIFIRILKNDSDPFYPIFRSLIEKKFFYRIYSFFDFLAKVPSTSGLSGPVGRMQNLFVISKTFIYSYISNPIKVLKASSLPSARPLKLCLAQGASDSCSQCDEHGFQEAGLSICVLRTCVSVLGRYLEPPREPWTNCYPSHLI